MAGTSSVALFLHAVEAMDAGGGLLGDAAPGGNNLMPALRVLGVNLLEQILDDLFFVRLGGGVDPFRPFSSS